ncbi:MAG TPA: saccharopine dehydrogenase NADP-binding domain-containing protein, partial [Burkholderiales bacterium]
MAKTVLLIGGYGVFGGRLTRLLVQQKDLRVIVAGRSLDQAQRFCAIHGGEAAAFDRDGEVERQIRALAPDIVVDAAG